PRRRTHHQGANLMSFIRNLLTNADELTLSVEEVTPTPEALRPHHVRHAEMTSNLVAQLRNKRDGLLQQIDGLQEQVRDLEISIEGFSKADEFFREREHKGV